MLHPCGSPSISQCQLGYQGAGLLTVSPGEVFATCEGWGVGQGQFLTQEGTGTPLTLLGLMLAW